MTLAGFQRHLRIYLVLSCNMVRSIYVAVFPMLHLIAVLFVFLCELDGIVIRVDFLAFGVGAWVHGFLYQRH